MHDLFCNLLGNFLIKMLKHKLKGDNNNMIKVEAADKKYLAEVWSS